MALASWVGCAEDADLPDGGVDASADAGPSRWVTPPDIPWLGEGAPPIMLAPCPEGWREVHGGAVTECDPYPAGGAESCDPGQAHFPGEPGCRSIGDPCPAGDYAASVPTSGSVLHVNAGAAAGGDGTLGAPFASLTEVPWVSLGASSTVALGKGSYEGTLPLEAGVRVIGACAEETVLTGIAGPVSSVVSVTTAGEAAMVQNLTIRGAPQRGAEALYGRGLILRGVLIDRVARGGIVAYAAGTEVTLSDVVIRDTQRSLSSPGEIGTGVYLEDGVHLEATRFLVIGNHGIGIIAKGEGATVQLSDAVVRDTRPSVADGTLGRGIAVESGARFEATRLLIAGNRDLGASVIGVGSSLTLTHAIVRDTEPRAHDGGSGRGISAERGAELSLAQLLAAGNHDIGIHVSQEGTAATLTDVVIRDTQPGTAGPNGRGLNVQEGAHCEGSRLVLSGNKAAGVMLDGPSAVTLADVLVQETAPLTGEGEFSRGVWAQFGGRLEVSRLLVADNRDLSIGAQDEGTVIDLSDVVIRDTRSRPADLLFGRGIQGQTGARIEGTRLAIDRSIEVGAFAIADGVVALSDVAISEVAAADCSSTTCADTPFGYAAAALGATLSLRRFHITGAATCGVLVASLPGSSEVASLDLEAGVVSESEIGACVQVDGYDFNRLTQDVQYRDNGTNLDSTSLPVPDVVEGL